MGNTKNIDSLLDRVKKTDSKIEQFHEILENLTSLDNKKKALWLQIYENAVSDRERASILFTEAFKSMGGGTSDHVAIGSILTKYLERMCKSNDQILSLADMISKAEINDSKIDPDDLFSKISEEK